MNNSKVARIVSLIVLICMFFFICLLLKLNILPTVFLIGILVITIIFTILGILFINLKFKVCKILGTIFVIISLLINCVGSYYLYFANDLLDKTFKNKSETITTYYVVSNAKNKLTTKYIKGNIYYYKDTINIDKALTKLKKDYKITGNEYQDITELFVSIRDNQNKLMLIDKDTYNIIFSLDKNFNKEDFEVVYKFKLKTVTNVKEKNRYSFNVYIGGKDFTNILMDFNMIASFNVKTKKILLTSIPRDYYIEVYGKDGRRDTLSYMGPYGIDTSIKSLEKLFDTNIDYYIDINTESLVGLVDTIGGINYCSDQDFTTVHAKVLGTYDDSTGDKLTIRKGCQELNGIETLTVARERKSFVGGDRQRQRNCQKIMIAIFDKLKDVNTLTNYKNILREVSNLYKTTIPRKTIVDSFKEILNGDNSWQIEIQDVDGTDSRNKVHLTNYEDYVMEPDMKTVEIAKNKIKEIIR